MTNEGSRLKECEVQQCSSRHPFPIYRWRMQRPEGHTTNSPSSLSEQLGLTAVRNGLERPPELEFPLSPDHHLLHLIHYNVFRALVLNKNIIDRLAKRSQAPPQFINVSGLHGPCWQHVRTRSTNPSLPASLCPTQIQMTHPHMSWIDLLPIPEFRDKMIQRQDSFNHWEMLQALIGGLVNRAWSYEDPQQTNQTLHHPLRQVTHMVPMSPGHGGLIVWGEPYLDESWEVTPEFLAMWGWALEGCEKLIATTNLWRARRGEDPISYLY